VRRRDRSDSATPDSVLADAEVCGVSLLEFAIAWSDLGSAVADQAERVLRAPEGFDAENEVTVAGLEIAREKVGEFSDVIEGLLSRGIERARIAERLAAREVQS
jgi:hypothetical protein